MCHKTDTAHYLDNFEEAKLLTYNPYELLRRVIRTWRLTTGWELDLQFLPRSTRRRVFRLLCAAISRVRRDSIVARVFGFEGIHPLEAPHKIKPNPMSAQIQKGTG